MSIVTLNIDAKSYGGWKGVTVNRTLEALAGSYELKLADRWPGHQEGAQVAPGAAASLSIDGTEVIIGHVDDAEPNHDGTTHEIALRGRDATGDLIDCDILPDDGIPALGFWSGSPLLSIANTLCAPFAIACSANADTGVPLRVFKVELGETVFAALDRLARLRQLLLTSDGKGGVLFTRAASGVAHSAIALGENILKGRGRYSWRDRYSKYVVMAQLAGNDFIAPEMSAGLSGEATDPAVTRYRPKLVMEDIPDYDANLFQKRAQWEASVRAARSRRFTETVNGWYDAQGKLWQPNDTVEVADAFLASYGSFLISGVKLSLDERGELAELTLVPPDAFLPEPMNANSDYEAAGLFGGSAGGRA